VFLYFSVVTCTIIVLLVIIGSGFLGNAIGREAANRACNQSRTTTVHVCSREDLRLTREVWQNALREVYRDYLDCVISRNRWSISPPRSGFMSRNDYRECSSLLGMLVVTVAIELMFLLRVSVVVY